jgi:predicted methyltransferase
MKMSIKILQGNCLETLSSLEEKSVNTCVTSPPYWGLRDYGNGDQLGQEETPEKFVESLVNVFREVRRVLRDDGTVWLNLGDSYHRVRRSRHQSLIIKECLRRLVLIRERRGEHRHIKVNGIKPKDLDRHSLACGFRTASRWLVFASGYYLAQT